jgi:MFS family permease
MYVIMSTVAAVGGFLFGYDLSVSSGAMIFLRREFHLTPYQMGFATGSALLGCMLGPVCGGWLSDVVGRRKALMIAALPFGLGAIGTAIPRNIVEFIIFRLIG